MLKLALFASGSGTNVENIIRYFKDHREIEITSVCCNNPKAFVLERARNHGVPALVFNRHDFYETGKVLHFLRKVQADWIILAGFLWLVPENILQAWHNRIVNIHPALLPDYGGKGMYGMRVHESVINNHDSETGITIHYVNREYDRGDTIFQAKCTVEQGDTPETLAHKVHQLEYEHYPKAIEQLVLGRI